MKRRFLFLFACAFFPFALSAQFPSGFDPIATFRADNGYNPSTIRNPVVLNDNLGTLNFSGWVSGLNSWYPGATIKAVVAGQPNSLSFPADLVFQTGHTSLENRFRIGSNGFVSVNSNDLPAQFSVTQYSDQNTGSNTAFLVRGGTPTSPLYFRIFNDKDMVSALLQGNFTVEKGNASISNGHLFIPSGRISVGTDKLWGNHVATFNGSVLATTFKIEYFSNWPDYVFGQGYSLPTIQEQEKFIAANHHLPEIPSAEEVAKDGFDVPEMLAAQLKEIEKLNLYIIELHKKYAALAEKVEKLEKGQ